MLVTMSIENISSSNSGRFAVPPKLVVRIWIWLVESDHACRW